MIVWLLACGSMAKLEADFEFANAEDGTWCSEDVNTKVLSVYDGDTVTVETLPDVQERESCNDADSRNEKIRLLGVAAPEIGSDPECYGVESAQFLSSILQDEYVELEFDTECIDVFCRRLAWIFLEGADSEIANMMERYSLTGLNDDGSYRLLVNELIIRSGNGVKFHPFI